MIQRSIMVWFIAVFMVLAAVPVSANAQASSYEISGWIPYWRSTKGVDSILPNIASFSEVNPFMYSVKLEGALNSIATLTDPDWVRLRTAATDHKARFIPTIMWANADAIHETLSNPSRRSAHVQAIASEVYKYKLDGIDIDYEGKYARTRPYFSLFLKELYEAIGYDKWVMCTIEARTPLDSRYETPADIPADIEYANDFAEINKYCDRVRFMTYDQGRIDVKLNSANPDPYAPVADLAWVRKVIELAAQDIDKSKIVIGVPTYGYEYDMFTDANGTTQYSRLWSFNPGYISEIVDKVGATPTRHASGEMMLVYPASKSPDGVIPLPNATRVMMWSDAESIRQKAALAKELGVRGIAIFKIDGGQDPMLPTVATAYATTNIAAAKPIDRGLAATESGGTVAGTASDLLVPTRDLQFGMRHEDVRALQKLLNAKGFTVAVSGGGSPGSETVYFGPATRAALIKFQKAQSITPAAGYYGPKTRAKFQSLLSKL